MNIDNFQARVNSIRFQANEIEDHPNKISNNEKIQKLLDDFISLKIELQNLGTDSPEISATDTKKMSEEFKELQTKVDKLRAKTVAIFKAQSYSLVERVMNQTIKRFENYIQSQAKGFIFAGGYLNNEKEKLESEVIKLNDQLNNLATNHVKETGLIDSLKIRKKETTEPDELNVLNQEIDYISEKIELIESNYKSKQKELSSIMKKLNDDFYYYEKKAEEMRISCEKLGGESMIIETPDGVKLDGMFLDAQKFRSKLKTAGCELLTIETKDKNNQLRKLQGLSISEENYQKSGKDVLDALEELHAFANEDYTGSGWSVLKDGKNLLIVRTDEIPNPPVEDHPFFTKTDELRDLKSAKRITKVMDTTTKPSGTVIHTGGAMSVFEMEKQETAHYLFKNINVMFFNFRGYGRSEGEPSEQGLIIDMESAYQVAKDRSGHEDNRILFKCLCMSAGPASVVASRHPECHIFLDQTYSNLKQLAGERTAEVVSQKIDDMLGGREGGQVKQQIVKNINNMAYYFVERFVKMATPGYDITQALSLNQGHKGILYVYDDPTVGLEHVERNITTAMQKVAEAGQTNYLSVIAMPGKHATSVLDIKATPLDFYPSLNREHNQLKETERDNLSKAKKEKEKINAADKDIKQVSSKTESELSEKNELLDTATKNKAAAEENLKKFQRAC